MLLWLLDLDVMVRDSALMYGKNVPFSVISAWSENGLFQLNQLSQMQPVPDEFLLKNAYPNPFNPVTTLRFDLPSKVKVIL